MRVPDEEGIGDIGGILLVSDEDGIGGIGGIGGVEVNLRSSDEEGMGAVSVVAVRCSAIA